MSIRLKIILPYLILTIVMAVIGAYVVTRLVDRSIVSSNPTIYLVLFIAVVISVVVIGYAVSQVIIKPLYSLVNASQAVAMGDLERRTGIHAKDEIGILANTFDEMTLRLQERTLELEQSNQMLKNIDRTRTNFIAISGHELRTPLTLVMGYSQMLERNLRKAPELQALAQGILEGAERMTDVVEGLLDVSRIDSNALVLRKVKVEVAAIIDKVQREFTPAFTARNIKFETIDLENLPSISASPEMLQKVFYHLVMNAIKYTPDGGNVKVIGRVIYNLEQPQIEIAIHDTGIGIDLNNQELIFQKFAQTGEVLLHSSGKTKFKGGGPGLGLAIARGIVDAHGGKIWVESPGHDEVGFPGSTFFVRLPVAKDTLSVK